MNSYQLKEQLCHRYNLVCFEDLATLSDSPYAAHKVFGDLYKSVFESNERFVFYSSETPSKDFIKHLYHVTQQIDISNCFVLLVAPGITTVVEKNTEYKWDYFDCLDLSVSDSKK